MNFYKQVSYKNYMTVCPRNTLLSDKSTIP